MQGGEGLEGYKDLLLFLGTAGLVVPVFARLKVSPVLGFLGAGVLLGPFGLGALAREYPWLRVLSIGEAGDIARLAEFGVAFLLFMIGLELSWDRLVRLRRMVFGLGSLQVGLSGLVLGAAAYAFGETLASAVVLGASLALSSTALVLPSLAERKRLHSAAGRASFAVLLLQDLAVAPLLILVAVLDPEGASGGLDLLLSLAPAVLALVVLVGFGRVLLRPLFQLVATTGSNELFVATCLLVVVGTSLVTAATGQSMSLGAFVAGLLLAETEYRRQVEVTIQPFQGLLLGLFFLSVGVGLDLSRLIAAPLVTFGIAGGLVAVKAALLLPLARAMGLPFPVARQVALMLGPGGEFALVLVGAAVASGVVPAASGATAMVAATLSMFAIPLLVRLSETVAPQRPEDEATVAALAPDLMDGPPRAIIVGCGRVGDLVGQMLARHEVPFIAVDADPKLVARARKDGRLIYYGDATRPELLRRCGIATASALIVTMDNPAAAESVVAAARAERPDLVIVARARDAEHAVKLYGLDVTDAVPETIEASLQLSEAVLVNLGIPMGLVIVSVHEKRDEFRKVLQTSAEGGRERRAIRASVRKGNGRP